MAGEDKLRVEGVVADFHQAGGSGPEGAPAPEKLQCARHQA